MSPSVKEVVSWGYTLATVKLIVNVAGSVPGPFAGAMVAGTTVAAEPPPGSFLQEKITTAKMTNVQVPFVDGQALFIWVAKITIVFEFGTPAANLSP
jgi:hypothetical protein